MPSLMMTSIVFDESLQCEATDRHTHRQTHTHTHAASSDLLEVLNVNDIRSSHALEWLCVVCVSRCDPLSQQEPEVDVITGEQLVQSLRKRHKALQSDIGMKPGSKHSTLKLWWFFPQPAVDLLKFNCAPTILLCGEPTRKGTSSESVRPTLESSFRPKGNIGGSS